MLSKFKVQKVFSSSVASTSKFGAPIFSVVLKGYLLIVLYLIFVKVNRSRFGSAIVVFPSDQGIIQKKSASSSWMLSCLEIFNPNFILIWKCQKWSLNRGTPVSATTIYQMKCPFTVPSALFLFFWMVPHDSRLFPADTGGYFDSHFVVVIVVFIFILLLKNVFFIYCKLFCQK